MDMNTYQAKALTTDTFNVPNEVDLKDFGLINKVLGLSGESGEVADKIKKILRNKDGAIKEEERLEIIKELGDVLWYLATLSRYLGADLDQVAKVNLDKLADRHKRGVIKSKGDNR